MSNTIGSTSQWMQRPDPTQMVSKLFSKLDTKNQGYLEKTDLQSALQSATGSSDTNVDELFAKLDSDSDGKVTQDEMSSTLKKLADQLDTQFHQMRAQGGMQGMGGAGQMPPPPPQGGDKDSGFTKDELSSQLNEIGSSDSQRSTLISNIVQNFEAADTDGDGKVSFKEAMAYDQKTQTASTSGSSTSTTGSTESTSSSSSTSSTSSSESVLAEKKLMKQIMALIHAYGIAGNGQSSTVSTASTAISTAA